MTFFSHFPKSAFWSHILLGMVAVFSLPVLPETAQANAGEEIVGQQFSVVELKKTDTEQPLFLQQAQPTRQLHLQQAVEFCEFSAKLYRLLIVSNPPIRAGPLS